MRLLFEYQRNGMRLFFEREPIPMNTRNLSFKALNNNILTFI